MIKSVNSNVAVCQEIKPSSSKTIKNGISYVEESLPIYKVLSIPEKAEGIAEIFEVKEGDCILGKSPEKITADDGKEYYIFKIENIIGKVDFDAGKH